MAPSTWRSAKSVSALSRALLPMLHALQMLFETFMELDRRVRKAAHEDEVCTRSKPDGGPRSIVLADACQPVGGVSASGDQQWDDEGAFAELRELIDRVDFISAEGLGKFQLEVHGSLAALLSLGQAQKAESPAAGAEGLSYAWVREQDLDDTSHR